MTDSGLVYIGTYTDAGSRGIYALRFDSERGVMGDPFLAAEASHPSFLAFRPDRNVLYAVDERGGWVGAYGVECGAGSLRLINRQPTGGKLAAHLTTDLAGRMLVVVNYESSSVAVFPLEPDGRIGPHRPLIAHHGPRGPVVQFQTQGRPHSVRLSPDGRFVAICDMGLDRVYFYRLDVDGAALFPSSPAFAQVPPGLGPRHAAFSRDGRVLYVLNGIGGTLSVFSCESGGVNLTLRQTVSTLPAGFSGASFAAEVVVAPDGRRVYASNRDPDGKNPGSDSVAVFERDPASGLLAPVEVVSSGGRHPRHFALSPDGNWLLIGNAFSDRIDLFRVDPATGRLTSHGRGVGVSRPVCLLFA